MVGFHHWQMTHGRLAADDPKERSLSRLAKRLVLAVLVWIPIAVVLTALPASGGDSEESAGSVALPATAAGVDSLLHEMEEDSHDLFFGPFGPDLLLVSTTDGRGETAPCG